MLTDSFLNAYKKLHPDAVIHEKKLYAENITCMTADETARRQRLIEQNKMMDKMFSNAYEFANADKVVIAAPYWDLSFPAILKDYVERISVPNIAFKYTEKGSVGLCKASKIIYISTAGGFCKKNLGAEYIEEIAKMYGITGFEEFTLGGLDIVGADIEALVKQGCETVEKIAEKA